MHHMKYSSVHLCNPLKDYIRFSCIILRKYGGKIKHMKFPVKKFL